METSEKELLEETLGENLYIRFRLDLPCLNPTGEPFETGGILGDHLPSTLNILVSFLSKFGNIKYLTYGEEIAWKTKKPHIHIHCTLEPKKPLGKTPLQQTFKLYLKSKNIDLVPRASSLTVLTTSGKSPIQSPSAHQRYPFKDYEEFEKIAHSNQIGYTITELRDLWVHARAERAVARKTFEKYEQKLNNDKLVWSKIVEYIDDNQKYHVLNHVPGNDDHDQLMFGTIGITLVKYYQEHCDHKIPMNIDKQVIRYISLKKLWTPQQIFGVLTKIKYH